MIHQQHGSIVFVEFDVGLVHDFSPGLLAKRLTLGASISLFCSAMRRGRSMAVGR